MKVWIEVGTSDFGLAAESLPQDHLPDDVFVVSFEPVLDKYASVLTRGAPDAERRRRYSTHVGLGRYSDRGIVLPFAIGPEEGMADFNIQEFDACSSLLLPQPAERGYSGLELHERCKTAVERRRVPVVSLQTVIEQWLGGREIQRLKVDAQGFDLQVVRSAGTQMHTLQRVSLEVNSDDCDLPYRGQPRCSEVMNFMSAFGFEFDPPPGWIGCSFLALKGACEWGPTDPAGFVDVSDAHTTSIIVAIHVLSLAL
eukprot:CAMPEP_0175971768 /NCGR_PEP_ID=MMETSP0108-20121206/41844_1 /TAXON_ID=195067 ORGANISM="Goniomonas pacifica, Strain CCMP1869" /NCGR_SAMPLE_ID=MMETSP0108 /ASSEMBLY_ACC=CAM_ASM_000204 /LENGTH=254 /DNA_ID=CAMNT_0017300985 /DNA_START=250 /DNA_END=1012 /DNA_ORIENTATION=-